MKNKKLIELGILSDDENSGVSAISLVENPAIEVDFLYFKSEKFVKPAAGENEGEFISRCMSDISSEFPNEDQRLAVCYSYWSEKMEITPNPCWRGYEPIGLKTKDGRKVPNCVKMESYVFEELDVFGYQTRFFFICPGAENTFLDLIELGNIAGDEVIGMTRSAAVVADRIFEIEKEVVDSGSATVEQMKEAIVLVDDFYDIIYEIDEELSEMAGAPVVHNVQYMDNHLETIASYLPEEMSIDTGGLPAYVDEIGKKKDQYANEDIPKPEYTNEEFENIKKLAKELGIKDTFKITEKFASPDDVTEIRYRYEGDVPQRQFCQTFMGQLYTRDEINQFSFQGVNKSFGHNKKNYSLFKYKGGPFCKHFWQKYEVNLTTNRRRRLDPVNEIEVTAATRPYDMNGNGRYPGTFTAFSALRFADEEQKIVVGPAMIPNMEIPRRDEDGDIYYVKFSEETIREIMMKFMKEDRNNSTNQDHNEDLKAGAYVYESWLVEDPETDKANVKYGFNVPAGTWMVSMKVDDKETWKRVKEGELRGFSVEGLFSNLEEIQTVKQYIKIMKILKD
jgi:hypothetical protein